MTSKINDFSILQLLVGFVIVVTLLTTVIWGFLSLSKRDLEDQLVLDGNKINSMAKKEFKDETSRAQGFDKSLFPDAKVSRGSEWKIASTKGGYCIAIWNPEAKQHNDEDFAYLWESSENTCQYLGYFGTMR